MENRSKLPFQDLNALKYSMKKYDSTICLHMIGFVLKKIPVKIALLIILISSVENVKVQEVSHLRRNTIKLDLTSNLLFRNAFNLSYERVRRPNQTYAITIGYQQFPKLSSIGTRIETTDDSKKRTGFKVGGEYRFYLKKEN